MCELILLVIPVFQCDEDAQVVRSSYNAHTGASELCAQLVIPSRAYAFLGAVNVEGGDGRVVRRLFGEVRDCDCLAVADHAVGAARGCRSRCLHSGMCVFDFPVTLEESARCRRVLGVLRTLKNSPNVELYGLHGLPLTYFCRFVSQSFFLCNISAY